MSNVVYSVTADEIQKSGQNAVDAVISRALYDGMIDEKTADTLHNYIVVATTRRGFTDRLCRLLKFKPDKQDGTDQLVWVATYMGEKKK